MMLELNYIVVPNNIEIGGGGLSEIFCGRLSGNWGKSSTGFGYLLHNIFFASAYVNVYEQNLHNIFGLHSIHDDIQVLYYAIVCPS
jgi:hypothetical protein